MHYRNPAHTSFALLLGLWLAVGTVDVADAARVHVDRAWATLAALARGLDRQDAHQRWAFAVVALDVLIDSYRDELRQAARELVREDRQQRKLARWQRGTQSLISGLDATRTRLIEGATFTLLVDQQQQIFVFVDGQPVAISGPSPRADRQIARRIVDSHCAHYDCLLITGMAPVQPRQTLRPAGTWAFHQNMRPTYELDGGRLACVFGDLSGRAAKARLCELLGEEIELLRDALAQARQQGHLADWQSLRQLSAADRARTSLRLNQAGAYLELDIPLLRSLADPDWHGLVDALQDPGDMRVTINHADRLL